MHIIDQSQSLHNELVKLGVPGEEANKQFEVLRQNLPAISKGKASMDTPSKAQLPAGEEDAKLLEEMELCLLYTSPSPRDQRGSRMPSSA